MISGIYQILNTVNGKSYVGQSININRRLNEHKSQLNQNKHQNLHLQNSWNKYGQDAFNFEILEYCDIDELDNIEQYYIKIWGLTNPKYGYNKDSGGNINKKHSKETKEKIKQSNLIYWEENPRPKGWHHTQEIKDKIRKSNTGKVFSQEHRDNISRAKKGKNMGEDHHLFGKHHSQETGLKISQAKNSTGFYRVFKEYDKAFKKGFRWRYMYYHNGNKKYISSVSLKKLEKKVVEKNLLWQVVDQNNALKSIKEDET